MMKRNPDFYNNLQTMTALSKTATPWCKEFQWNIFLY
jgi:hypothetical protein